MIDVNKPIETTDGVPCRKATPSGRSSCGQYLHTAVPSGRNSGQRYFDPYTGVGIYFPDLKIRNVAEAAPTHTFKVGDEVITRDGSRRAKVIYLTDTKMILLPPNTSGTISRNLDGSYRNDRQRNHMDFLPAPKEDVRYHTLKLFDRGGDTYRVGGVSCESLDDPLFSSFGYYSKALKITYRDNQPFAVELVDLP